MVKIEETDEKRSDSALDFKDELVFSSELSKIEPVIKHNDKAESK